METTGLIIIGLILFIAGFIGCVFYIVGRMMKTIGDDSNMNNALRLLSQATIHPEDFGRMYYLTHAQMKLLRANGHEPMRPGWYVNGDEFADVVKTRPTEDHV
jgi:hypothetical protein